MFGKKKRVEMKKIAESKKGIRDFESDLLRNNKGNGQVTNCSIDRDEFTITVDIDGQMFEMTYGQAAIMLMALKGIYNA